MIEGINDNNLARREESLAHSETPLEKKLQQWEVKMAEMVRPDVYGYVLDEGIRETVVALQLLGFNTTQSDQGNYSITPWVQFEAEPPKNIYEGEQELKTSIMAEFGILPDEIDEHSLSFDRKKQVDVEEGAREKLASMGAQHTQEYKKWHEETIKLANKLQGVINEFYALQPTSEEFVDLRVFVEFPYRAPQYAPYIQDIPLLEVKTNPSKNLSEEELKQLGIRTQYEMRRFTEFLKKRFFSDIV